MSSLERSTPYFQQASSTEQPVSGESAFSFRARAEQRRHSQKFQELALRWNDKIRSALSSVDPRTETFLKSLEKESDAEIFFFSLLNLGRDLLKRRCDSQALALFQTLQEKEVPPSIQEQARREYEAVAGLGSTGMRLEYLGGRFFEHASDYKMILPALAGTAIFQTVRAATLAHWTGKGRNLGATLFGLSAEIPGFALASRALHRKAGDPVRESVWEDLGATGLMLGTMKFSGWAASRAPSWARILASPASTFLGLLASHQLELAFGLREENPGATTLTDIFSSMITLGIGGHLGKTVLGTHFAKFQMEAELRWRNTPEPKMQNFSAAGSRAGVPVSSTLPARLPGKPTQSLRAGIWMAKGDGEGRKDDPSITPPPKLFRKDDSIPIASLAFDPTPYQGILQNGIRSAEDLAAADRFFVRLDPEDFGKITAATQEVPHRLAAPTQNATGAVSLGQTRITFAQAVDRAQAGAAKEISLAVFPDRGVDPLTLIHERVHASPFQSLPSDYQIALPEIPKRGHLAPTYQAILEGRYWDEALAFGAMARLVERFQNKTGRDFYEFSLRPDARKEDQPFLEAYRENGFRGIFDWVQEHPAYLPYKVGALYLAILAKHGAEDFPPWEEILKLIGAEEVDGRLSLSPESLTLFFQIFIGPIVERHQADLLLGMQAMTPEESRAALLLPVLLAGGMTPPQAEDFLKRDFDSLVRVLGALMGDRLTAEGGPRPISNLPPRPVPLRPGNAEEIDRRRETVADKVEILGRHVNLLKQFSGGSQDEWERDAEVFLHYAELADPVSAAQVYSRLIAVYQERVSKVEPDHDYGGGLTRMGWSLGLSLLRSNYGEEAQKILNVAFPHLKTYLLTFGSYDANEALALGELIPLGLGEVAQKYWQEIFSQWKSRPPNRQDYYNRFELLTRILSGMLNSASKEARILPASLRSGLERDLREIWDLHLATLRDRIEAFRVKHGISEEVYQSLDEWTKPGKSAYYLLSEGEYSRTVEAIPFLQLCLGSPTFFRLGLEFLRAFPSCSQQVELYQEATKRIPEDFSDRERLELVEAYQEVLKKQEAGLRAWNFRERESRGSDESPPEGIVQSPQFDQTHFYFEHRLQMARILLSGKDPGTREKGWEIIQDLSEDPTQFSNPHSKGKTFQPALGKAAASLALIDLLPESQRPIVLENSFRWMELGAGSEELWLRWVKAALRYGSEAQARRGLESWRLGRSFSIDYLNFDNPGSGYDTLHPFFQVILENGKGWGELMRRVQRDIRGGRGRFSLVANLEILKLLSALEFGPRLPDRETKLLELSRTAIDLYVQGLGKEKTIFSKSSWAPLVQTLKALPIQSKDRDAVFAYLVERVSPEPGVFVTQAGDLGALWQSYQSLDFILENPEMPRAEALLLGRFAAVLKKFSWDANQLQAHGAAKGLDWFFRRLAAAHLLDPSQEARLRALRNESHFQSAVDALFSFAREEVPSLDPDRAREIYREALSQGDLVLLETHRAALRQALLLEMQKISPDNIFSQDPTHWNFPTSLVAEVRRDWLRARSEGNFSLAEKLFELWAVSESGWEADFKAPLYYEALKDPRFEIDAKRRVFQEMCKSKKIQPYTQKKWRIWVDEGETDRERALYYMMGLRGRYPDSQSCVAMLADLRQEEIPGFLQTVQKFYQPDSNHASSSLEIRNPSEWKVYWSRYPGLWGPVVLRTYLVALKYNFLPQLMAKAREVALKEGQENLALGIRTLDEFRARHLGRMEVTIPSWAILDSITVPFHQQVREEVISPLRPYLDWEEDGGRTWGELEAELSRLSSGLTPEEAASLLERFDLELNRYLRSRDKEKTAFFEMPALFKDRDPLTRFLLSRYFLNMPGGEQQILLQEIKDASPETALRIFFEKAGLEKVGQFLSFWPEVPEKIRTELSHLQDQVEPSDLEEVRETLRKELAHPLRRPKDELSRLAVGATATHFQEGLADFKEDLVVFIRNEDGVFSTEIISKEEWNKSRPALTEADFQAILDNLEPDHLGSGSIGECYKSKLADGTAVVVKVIPKSKKDAFLRAIGRAEKLDIYLEVYAEEIPGAREAQRLLRMFVAMVKKELILSQEAANMDLARFDLPEGIRIPQVWFASQRVLVQEFVQGQKLEAVEDPVKLEEVLERIRDYFYSIQVRKRRRYHSDLQPGNKLYNLEKDLVYILDFGQVGSLTALEGEKISEFIDAAAAGDPLELTRVLEEMAERQENYRRETLLPKIETLLQKEKIDPRNLSGTITKLFKICHDAGLWIALPYLQLLKGVATMEAGGRKKSGPH